jgi:hypothetical protein
MRRGSPILWMLVPALGLACSVSDSSRVDLGDFGTITEFGWDTGEPWEVADGAEGIEPQDPGSPKTDTGGTTPGSEYPSAELLLKITGPAGNGYATTPGSLVSVAGLVFGKFDKVNWVASSGASGSAVLTGGPYWQTDGIQLVQGDNVITVTASSATETAADSIVVTYNPSFIFTSPIEVRPSAMFVGEQQKVFATLAMGPFSNLSGTSIPLQVVDENGALVKNLGNMLDDGKMSTSGDEIEKDGVYTLQFNLMCSNTNPLFLRATPTVKGPYGKNYTAYSAPARIDCVNRLAPATCSAHQKTLAQARDAYTAAIDGGSSYTDARAAAVAVLTGDASAQEVVQVPEIGGLWVLFNDGVAGAVNTGRADTRGDGDEPEGEAPAGDMETAESALSTDLPVMSKDTLLMSPFNSEFGGTDETQFIYNIASKISCPAYNLKGPYNDAAANLTRLRSWSHNGAMAIATHGDVYFKGMSQAAKQKYGWRHMGSQEVLWTGEAVDCGKLTSSTTSCSSDAQCKAGTSCLITQASFSGGKATVSGICFDATQVDLMMGRVVLGDRTYGVNPAFFLKYGSTYKAPETLAYLGACRTLYNGGLAVSMLATGAMGVAGYSGVVSSKFASEQGAKFFAQMMEQKQTAGEAYGVGAQDPNHPGSFFRYFGARNLSLSGSDILNPSFETGDLTAWNKDGDGRVVTKLGVAGPVSGKFMSIISTGLGFTTQLGSIEQTFCIPSTVSQMSFFWKYYSEEFHEWCGSQFQDTFQAKLVAKGGKEYQVISLAVDDLCAKNDCSGCGSKYVGLVASDVQFDQGDNYKTDWKQATYKLGGLAGGGPVTLRFFCTDKGDSIYDTATLVDHIKFE